MSFWVVTDSGCDLPLEYVESREKFLVMPMPYRMGDEERMYKPGDEKQVHSFYESLNSGARATTAQINSATYYEAFKSLTDRGEQVLCVPLSSGISGSIQSANIARGMVLEENPNARVEVLDSLCASMGQGLFVHDILGARDRGLNLDETLSWGEEARQRVIHWFTVDDLNFLFRGGRVSRTSAFLGGMLRIKPVLHVNAEGRLIPREKVQGRKKSLRALADKIISEYDAAQERVIFISHGDCEEDALFVKELVKMGLKEEPRFLISAIGCVVGAHSGPGTLAVFFHGKRR